MNVAKANNPSAQYIVNTSGEAIALVPFYNMFQGMYFPHIHHAPLPKKIYPLPLQEQNSRLVNMCYHYA